MPEISPPTGPARVSFVLFAVTVVFLLIPGAQAQNPCAGPWSITNQPPPSCPFYGQGPNNVTNKRLPSNIMLHLASGGDTRAQTAVGSPSGDLTQYSTPGADDYGVPLYYSAPTDPYYKTSGCSSTSFGQTFAFRAPNNAAATDAARPDHGSTGDSNVRVWDQSTGIVWGAYPGGWTSSTPYRIGSSSAASPDSATTIASVGYCGLVKNIFTDQDWGKQYGWLNGEGQEGSSNFPPFAGIVRNQELIQGQINHALVLGVACTNAYNGSYNVFPSYSETSRCTNATNMPPNGALLFFDYTDAQINAMGLPAWQKTLITAMSHYGGYVDVTGNSGGTGGLGFNFESGLAYQMQSGGSVNGGLANGVTVGGGTPDPIFAWLSGQGISKTGSSANDTKYPLFWLNNIPNVNGTGVTSHIHMADPCVAQGYANQPGGCVTASSSNPATAAPAAPTGLTAIVQ
jgi:hypothetical protein